MAALDNEEIGSTDVREDDRGRHDAADRASADHGGSGGSGDIEHERADPDGISADAGAYDDTGEESGEESGELESRRGMTPRQARHIRAVTSAVVMVAVAVALVLRLGSAPSLVTVGGYGMALILSGTAIVLSRRGRTRVATAVLACGFVTVLLAEKMLSGA